MRGGPQWERSRLCGPGFKAQLVELPFILHLLHPQLALSIITGCAAYAWRQGPGLRRPHLALDRPEQGNWQSAGAYIPLVSLTAWILYSYLVPISLFVTM